jgi:hypothetical protein
MTALKIRPLSGMLNETYAKFYNPCEHLVVDEVIVLLRGAAVFK